MGDGVFGLFQLAYLYWGEFSRKKADKSKEKLGNFQGVSQ